VTGGIRVGVRKDIGEAVRQHTITHSNKKPIATIGIAVFGCVSNGELLVRVSFTYYGQWRSKLRHTAVHWPFDPGASTVYTVSQKTHQL